MRVPGASLRLKGNDLPLLANPTGDEDAPFRGMQRQCVSLEVCWQSRKNLGRRGSELPTKQLARTIRISHQGGGFPPVDHTSKSITFCPASSLSSRAETGDGVIVTWRSANGLSFAMAGIVNAIKQTAR